MHHLASFFLVLPLLKEKAFILNQLYHFQKFTLFFNENYKNFKRSSSSLKIDFVLHPASGTLTICPFILINC